VGWLDWVLRVRVADNCFAIGAIRGCPNDIFASDGSVGTSCGDSAQVNTKVARQMPYGRFGEHGRAACETRFSESSDFKTTVAHWLCRLASGPGYATLTDRCSVVFFHAIANEHRRAGGLGGFSRNGGGVLSGCCKWRRGFVHLTVADTVLKYDEQTAHIKHISLVTVNRHHGSSPG
jgi:hypothetical protein